MKRTPRTANHVNRHEVRKLSETDLANLKNIVAQDIRQYLNEVASKVLRGLMEAESESLCGPRYERNRDREFVRHGYQNGSVTVLEGGKQTIERPRVRNCKTGKEAKLTTYEIFSDSQILDEKALALIDAGVSRRQFQKTIRKGLKGKGLSPSSISRRIIRSAEESLKEFTSRKWHKFKFVALLFDGVRIGDLMVLACIGVDLSGRKHVLGIQPGASESERVCRDLIRNLIERGLDPDGNYLFVVDGSKALRKAASEAFGPRLAFQRCQEHKIRDVQAYVPFKMRDSIRKKLQAAYNTRSYEEASSRLQKVRSELGKYEQAKSSLTEGLEDTLTLHKLKIWGGLKDTLRTTNVIESAFSTLRRHVRNVTNWQDEAQVNRSVAHGLLLTEQRFRKVPGHRTLTRLKRHLDDFYKASQSPDA